MEQTKLVFIESHQRFPDIVRGFHLGEQGLDDDFPMFGFLFIIPEIAAADFPLPGNFPDRVQIKNGHQLAIIHVPLHSQSGIDIPVPSGKSDGSVQN